MDYLQYDGDFVKVKIGPVQPYNGAKSEIKNLGPETEDTDFIVLGVRNATNPDYSKPNPVEINWWQEFTIVEHHVVGNKPLTQCTEPEALWKCSIKLHTLASEDPATSHASKTLKSIYKMNAGPYWIEDSLTTHAGPGRICMYLEKKEIPQKAGTKDWFREITLQFKQANDGIVDAS